MTFQVTNPDTKTDAGLLELDGADSIVSADVGGFTYVFVAGGVDDGVSVFRLNANGTLTSVANVTDDATLKLDGARGLSTAMIEGNTYLFAAGQVDNGVSVFRVGTNGSLTNVANVGDDGTLFLNGVTDTATARVGTSTYLFTTGTADDGVSVFRVAGNGALTSVANLADNGTLKLDGVDALTTVSVGGTSFLVAAGGVDNGISVFSIAANGTLTNTNNFSDNGTLNLAGASDVTTAVIGGVTYVFVAGAADNGVSVFSLNSSGILTNISNVTDSASTLFAGASSVSVSTIGQTTYLSVGGTESGFSLFRVESGNNGSTAGTLTFMENVPDTAGRALGGATSVGSASIGGTNYLLGAGATEDGVSTFGSTVTGQLFYFGSGDPTDSRLAYLNNDGGNQTVIVDNNPTVDLKTAFPEEVGLDTAAGFYFAIVNGGPALGDGAMLVRGSLAGGAATTLFTYPGPDNILGNSDDGIVNAMQLDVFSHKIYVGIQFYDGSTPTLTGIRQYTYDPLTGAVVDNGFIATRASSNKPQESGFDVLDARDFALDTTTHNVFYTERLDGGVNVEGLWRFNQSTPNTMVQVVSQAQFPDNHSNGYIIDVEVDRTTGLLYFDTESQKAFGNPGYNASQNQIWWIDENAVGGTAVQLTFTGGPPAGHFYPGDMQFDPVTRQLYVETEEVDIGSGADTDDVIYVFQLSVDGHSASLINTITLNPSVTNLAANIDGMAFNSIPALTGIAGTLTHAGEQSAAGITLLTGAPTITDTDGDHLASATVQITGGLFSSNESNATDDHLAYGAGLQISGLIAGTNITLAFNAATSTLTLTGYDTFANYQAALAQIRYFTTGDNPTNYGLDTTRTITWTVSDGALNIPGGEKNSATTSITIDAVNDAPTNNGIAGAASGNEDTVIAVTGLSVSDPDANPALANVTVTLSVTQGILTLLTNVAGGLTSGEITNNNSASISITATLDEINATLANATGLTYTPNANYNGADTLHIVSNDGGNLGSGGALGDTDDKTITILSVNDAPTVVGGTTQNTTTILEDTPLAAGQSATSLFSSHFDDSTDLQQTVGNPTGSVANTFAGIAVTANGSSGTTGQWQYSTNGGSSWQDIGAVTVASARLYAAGTLIRFNPALDYNGAEPTLTVHLIDSSGGAVTDNSNPNLTGLFGGINRYSAGTVDLGGTITAVNDAPVDTVPGAQTINEDATRTFSTANSNVISVADVDVGAGNLTVTLSVAHGTLTLNGVVGLDFTGGTGDGTADPTMTFSGTAAAINTALNGLVYTPTGNYNGADTLTITTNDNGNSGQDPGLTGTATSEQDSDTVTINITPVNDAPTVVGGTTQNSTTIAEDTPLAAGQSATSLFSSHFDDSTDLQQTGGNPTGSLANTFAGIAVTANGSSGTTGQWQYSTNGGTTWQDIGAVTVASARLYAAGTLIRFNPVLNYNGAEPNLTVHLIDSSGGAVTDNSNPNLTGLFGGTNRYSSGTVDLGGTVSAVNDAPVFAALNGTPTFTEGGAAVVLDNNATITDVDLTATNYAGATLTLARSGAASAQDVFGTTGTLSFDAPGSGNVVVSATTIGTFTQSGGTLTITFNSSATQALVNSALQQVTYSNNSDNPPASAVIAYVFSDGNAGAQGPGGPLTANGSATVTITPTNDAPTAVVPGAVGTATEQTAFSLKAMGLSVGDIDGNSGSETVTLSVGQGVLNVTAGTSGAVVTNSGSAAVTISGTIAQINALLNTDATSTVSYFNSSDAPAASTSLSLTIHDNGATGGGDLNAAASGTITITAVNDGPVNTVPGAQTINEDGTRTFSGTISVADADVGVGNLTVTLSVAHGTLTLSGIAGLDFTGGTGDGTADPTMTFSGTAAAINAALNGLVYTPTADYNGSDTLSITTNDNGNTGTPGALQDVDTVTINITPVADIVNDSVSATEDTPANLDLLANDTFENAGRAITAVGTASHGTVTINDNGNGPGSDDFVVYTPNADYNGSDSFTYTVTSGGVTETATVNVTVTAVADIADDNPTTTEDTAVDVPVLSNDTFAATPAITNVGAASHGTAVLNDHGTPSTADDFIIYTPNADYNGADSFTYTVTSGGVTETATVNVTVTAVADIADDSISVLQGSGSNSLNLLANDNFESAGRTITSVTQGLHGTVAINQNGNGPGSDDFVTYTPTGAYQGSDSFTYTVTSGGVTETATVTVNVAPPDAAPVVDLNGAGAGIDNTASYTENAAPTVLSPTDLAVTDADDTNIESAIVSVGAGFISNFDYLTVNGGTNGTITGITFSYSAATGILSLTGSATLADYQAVLAQVGFESTSDNPGTSRTISWTVNDGTLNSTAALTTVTVTPVDDPAVAHNDAVSTNEATLLNGNVFSNNGSGADSDPDNPLSVSAVNGSGANVGTQIALTSGALLKLNANGTFSYDPNHAFDATPAPGSGASNTPASDSFTYTLTGGGTATVLVTVDGLDSNDVLLGTAGADTLNGGIGNDHIDGLGGADTMAGGTGNDTYAVDNAGDKVLETGGQGFDIAYVITSSYTLTAGSEVEWLSGIDWTLTTPLSLTGNELAQSVYGNAGANFLNGNGGGDTMYGFGGDDTYVVNAAGDTIVETAGHGFDIAYVNTLSYTLTPGSEVEWLSGIDWTFTTPLSLVGNELAQSIYGNAGNNMLNGNGGGDTMFGFGGDDVYVVNAAADMIMETAGQGFDVVYVNTPSYVLNAGSEVERMSAIDWTFTTPLSLTGNELAQDIYGNAGDNVLDGKGGNDVLSGLGGSDTFAFTTALGAGNVDTILDFQSGTDKIALDDAVFTAIGGPGALNANAFVVGTSAGDADDRIIYDQTSGNLYYDADGNGAGAAILFANLNGHPTLTASDFTVI